MFFATFVHMDPHATSSESLRALHRAVDYPWMLWSALACLALWSIVM